MNSSLCNVALPVPLRTTFTYAVPEALRGSVAPGSRVLAPFRKKAMVGVVVEFVQSPPEGTKVRELTRALDFVPALTPKLIELARWIAGYYLAPIGDVFRAMLPPVVELRSQRHVVLTPAGKEMIEKRMQEDSNPLASSELSNEEGQLLGLLSRKKSPLVLRSSDGPGVDCSVLLRLHRRGVIEFREEVVGRNRTTPRVVAWKPSTASESPGEKEQRVRELLETERGPLPFPQLLKLAQVTRSVIDRMLRDKLLESWEESIDPAEDAFDAGYTPPAHELNPEQESALKGIRARMPFSALSCSGFNSCAGGVYPASNASSAGSIDSSQLSSSLSRNIRSITERVTCASFSSCGNGSGPRSVSSNSRTRCSFSPGDSEAVEGFQATMRCVLRFRPTTSSRNSIKPRRWSLRRTLPSTPSRSEERSTRGDFLRERSTNNCASSFESSEDARGFESSCIRFSIISLPTGVKTT